MSSEIPGDLKFLKSHEWVRIEGDGRATVGISDHAQGLLGDLVYVELPAVGDDVEAGNACAVVESVKAASDVYAPISGTVTSVNTSVSDSPEAVNQDAYAAWLFKMKPANIADVDALLDATAYAAAAAE